MAIVFMTDSTTGRCALYDENGAGGAANDPNSSRNAPLNSPMAHLDKIYFHSDFDYLEVAFGPTVVPISHAAVTAGSLPPGSTIAYGWNAYAASYSLLTHSLGYNPQAIVVVGGNVIWPGMPVQVQADGGARYVSVYVTTSEIRLYEWASIGVSTLPATALNYTVLVFKAPPAPSGIQLIDWNSSTEVVKMGYGKFDSSRRYLQVVPGGSPYGISYGRTLDLNNGALRAYTPGGTAYEPVPVALSLGLYRLGQPYVYGFSMAYGGSFPAPANILVQAP